MFNTMRDLYTQQKINHLPFRFIDLFAGIGGFHLAAHSLGGKCVFACEIDKFARETYLANHAINKENFAEDITKVPPLEVPDHEILCAGFPCQPFSQAGHKKGFEDTRGTLFFNIANIVKAKKPQVLFLENVRHLLKHDNGSTFKIIQNVVTKELGYKLYHKIVYASDFGVPQHRPRLFMIAIRNDLEQPFTWPEKLPLEQSMSDVWEGECTREIGFTLRVGGRGSPITDRRNWDSYFVNGEVKRLSPKEGLRMQGFPQHFYFPVSQTEAMKQLGNSVAVPAIREVLRSALHHLNLKEKATYYA